MDFVLKIGDKFIKLDGRYLIKEKIEYNPFSFESVAGFYLRGDRILPVIDLQKALNLKRRSKRVFLVSDKCVFLVEYDSLSRGLEGEEIDLDSIFREVEKKLNGRS